MDTYEKKYKEALEKARQLCAYPTSKPFISDLQDLFPELTESNDERIRKELIDAILGLWDNDALPMPLSVKRKDEWIAWLEKQCYTKKDVDDAYLKGICYTKHELEKQEEPELSEDLGEYVAELSKQFPEVSFAKLSRIAVRVKNWIEKQGEQKSAYKVEPKFQNGQWIVWQNKCYKVNYNGCGYELIDQNGLSTSLEYGTVDTSARLWDITKDAKDGDVLIDKSGSRECPFVFKATKPSNIKTDIPNPLVVLGYCGIGGAGFTKGSGWGDTANCIYYPATKEQCDTLERAITNAGYTFNFEKKELKKIKQKPQRMVSAEAKEALYDKPTDEEMKELLRTEYEKGRADAIAEMYVPTQISPEESLGVSSEKYMDIVDTLTQGGQKPAKWSLEDERVIAIINNALTESNTPPDDYDKVYDWLESIKQRI